MKQFLLVSMFILFSTYINANTVNIAPVITYLLSDTTALTVRDIAIRKIKAYADDQAQPIPTVQDYIDAGVTGVTLENLSDVNTEIAKHTSSEVDTTAEIQAVVENVINHTRWDVSNWDELIWK